MPRSPNERTGTGGRISAFPATRRNLGHAVLLRRSFVYTDSHHHSIYLFFFLNREMILSSTSKLNADTLSVKSCVSWGNNVTGRRHLATTAVMRMMVPTWSLSDSIYHAAYLFDFVINNRYRDALSEDYSDVI